MKVREGSQMQLFFSLTDADGHGARLSGKRVELVLADKDKDKRETLVLNNQQPSRFGILSVGAQNQRQVLTAVGTSGTFKLQYNQSTTSELNYNATAAQVQAALAAIPAIGNNVRCSGGPLGQEVSPVIIEFIGDLFNTAQPLLQAVEVSPGLTVTVTGQTLVYLKPTMLTFSSTMSPYSLYFRVIDPVEGIVTYPEDGSYFITIEVEPSYVMI